MADRLAMLIGDRNLAVEMGSAGRMKAEKMFGLNGMLDRLENVFGAGEQYASS